VDPPAYASDLKHFWGSPITGDLVKWGGRTWYAKAAHGDPWREVLAFHLGKGWLNVAEVVNSEQARGASWADGRTFDPVENAGRVLVRIAQDYGPGELPLANLDQAIATELAFSVWIRRRDAHPWNRAYVSGVPIFFDHHIAFGAEAENYEIGSFFRPGGDGGYAGRWRVRTLLPSEQPTTGGERSFSGEQMAVHRVRDLSAFDTHLSQAVEHIRQITDSDLRDATEALRADNVEDIASFLIKTRGSLDEAVATLRSVVSRGDNV
jgi:hypothetical protein